MPAHRSKSSSARSGCLTGLQNSVGSYRNSTSVLPSSNTTHHDNGVSHNTSIRQTPVVPLTLSSQQGIQHGSTKYPSPNYLNLLRVLSPAFQWLPREVFDGWKLIFTQWIPKYILWINFIQLRKITEQLVLIALKCISWQLREVTVATGIICSVTSIGRGVPQLVALASESRSRSCWRTEVEMDFSAGPRALSSDSNVLFFLVGGGSMVSLRQPTS